MSDLALQMTKNLDYDLVFDGRDLVLSNSLTNSVVISTLVEDRESMPTSADINTVRGGWWGDSLESYHLGSKLWTLLRHGITPSVLKKAAEHVKKALKWMLDDGIAKAVEVSAVQSSQAYRIDLEIKIEKPDGSVEPYKWQVNWRATNGL